MPDLYSILLPRSHYSTMHVSLLFPTLPFLTKHNRVSQAFNGIYSDNSYEQMDFTGTS